MERESMSTMTARKAVPADYLKLVKEFPLRPLRNKSEHDGAMRIYSRFAGREALTPGQDDYIDALTHFIAEYEGRAHRHVLKLTPIEALRFLMEENEMNTTALGAVVGSRGLASDLLHGNRGFS